MAHTYRQLFQDIPGVRMQEIAPNSEPCFWLNCILLDKSEEAVHKIGEELIAQGIEIRPAFWPLSDLPAFRKYGYGWQGHGMKLLRELIVLPSSVKLAQNDAQGVKEIVEIVKKTMEKY